MGTRVYVGNLSFGTSEETLRAACGEGGRQVTRVSLPTDRDTGRPRGFAFVDFGTEADASSAISAMNGTLLDGAEIKEAWLKPGAVLTVGKVELKLRSSFTLE